MTQRLTGVSQSVTCVTAAWPLHSTVRPMSHLQFSRDKIASVTWRVARVFNSRTTLLPNRALLYSEVELTEVDGSRDDGSRVDSILSTELTECCQLC